MQLIVELVSCPKQCVIKISDHFWPSDYKSRVISDHPFYWFFVDQLVVVPTPTFSSTSTFSRLIVCWQIKGNQAEANKASEKTNRELSLHSLAYQLNATRTVKRTPTHRRRPGLTFLWWNFIQTHAHTHAHIHAHSHTPRNRHTHMSLRPKLFVHSLTFIILVKLLLLCEGGKGHLRRKDENESAEPKSKAGHVKCVCVCTRVDRVGFAPFEIN